MVKCPADSLYCSNVQHIKWGPKRSEKEQSGRYSSEIETYFVTRLQRSQNGVYWLTRFWRKCLKYELVNNGEFCSFAVKDIPAWTMSVKTVAKDWQIKRKGYMSHNQNCPSLHLGAYLNSSWQKVSLGVNWNKLHQNIAWYIYCIWYTFRLRIA